MIITSTLMNKLRREIPGISQSRAEPLSRHTSFGIGGPAELMVFPQSMEQLIKAAKIIVGTGERPMYLGSGTNVLARDEGFAGVIIKTKGVADISRSGDMGIVAECGATLAHTAVQAQRLGLSGMEFAHGIPGSVGGAVIMNAGAYGGEIKDVITATEFMRADGRIEVIEDRAQGFVYRDSAFSGMDGVILRSWFSLYRDVPEMIQAKMKNLSLRRLETQPLEYPSAGSTFKRPDGHYAAALIEQAGLKGAYVGGAMVSPKHAGFIINKGGATCRDVLELIDMVKQRVMQTSGVELEMEVKLLQ